jgi:predicted aminopeptidase
VFRRKRQFDELIERQLDIFAAEHADDLREIAEARLRWRRSDVEDAEEAFGDEQDRVEWAAEEVEKMADAYASTLDEDAAIAYRAALLKRLRKRYPPIADALRVALGDDDEDD